MAQYRALFDLELPGSLPVEAGTIFSDPSWLPAVGAVDPLDSDAIQAVWNVGPQGLDQASPHSPPWIGRGWLTGPPKCYWTRSTDSYFTLKGGGEGLGPRSALATPAPAAPPAPQVLERLLGVNWSVAASPDMSRIIVGSQNTGVIGVSSDSGNTFTMNTSLLNPATAFVRDIVYIDDQTWLINNPGNDYMYRTTNFGGSWTRLTATGTHRWGCFAISDDGNKIISTSEDATYLSTDRGATWTIRTHNWPGSHAYNTISGNSDLSVIFAVDANQTLIYKSTDFAQSWTVLPNQPTVTSFIQALYVSQDGQIIMGGDFSGDLYRSINGGISWSSINMNFRLNCFNRRIIGATGQVAALAGNFYMSTTHDYGANFIIEPVLAPFWVNNFTSPFHVCISNNGVSIVTGTEYFNLRLLVRQ